MAREKGTVRQFSMGLHCFFTHFKQGTVLIVGDTIVLDYLFKNVCIATALENLVVSPSRAKYNTVSL